MGYRGRGGGGIDAKGLTHYNGFKGLDVVELIYSTEPSNDAYAHLKADFPWRPGILYVADVEVGGLTTDQGRKFCDAARKDGKPAVGYRSLAAAKFGADHEWIAQYGPSSPPSGCFAWQYYGGIVGETPHHFAGVSGSVCDMNKLIAPLATVRKWAGLDGEEEELTKDEHDALMNLNKVLGGRTAQFDFIAGVRKYIDNKARPPDDAGEEQHGWDWANKQKVVKL